MNAETHGAGHGHTTGMADSNALSGNLNQSWQFAG